MLIILHIMATSDKYVITYLRHHKLKTYNWHSSMLNLFYKLKEVTISCFYIFIFNKYILTASSIVMQQIKLYMTDT